MPRPLLLFLVLIVGQLSGCATSPTTTSQPATPLPDGRDLAEQPLDVLQLPQP